MKELLKLEDVGSKVLVEYYREKTKNVPVLVQIEEGVFERNSIVIKGRPIGVVVAIAPGVIGWSLCNQDDVFSKEKAIDLALNRAFLAENMNEEVRTKFYAKMPRSLDKLFVKMDERSQIYFTDDLD
jgi:hypothetical protein